MAVQIVCAGAQNSVDGCELANDDALLIGLADANCKIGSFLDQIDIVVGDVELDANRRMGFEEFLHVWRNVAAAKHHRHVEAEYTPWRLGQLGDRGIRVVDLGDDAARAFVVEISRFGQSEAAGRPVEKSRSEFLFQRPDLA